MRSYLSAPLRVDLNLTSRCHLRCKYCYASAGGIRNETELSISDLEKFFIELEEMGVFRIQLAGGEPTMRKDFPDILSLLEKFKFSVSLNTTGLFLSKDICKRIAKGNFELVTVSLEGDTAELHEKIKGGKSFPKAIDAIKALKKENINTAIGITLNSFNIDSIFRIIDLVRTLGVDLVGIQVLCPVGRLSENPDLVPGNKRYTEFVTHLIDYQTKNPFPKVNLNVTNEGAVCWEYYFPLQQLGKIKQLKEIWEQNIKHDEKEISCVAGISVCSVGADGEVYPCEMFISDINMSAGNIRTKNFKKIWGKSELFKKFRNLKKSNLTGPCSLCKYRWCGAGCRAAAYYMTGDLNGTDKHCYYAQSPKQ
ncbi:hypothetical protein COY48_02290 [Candidatus Collierbacteria bacterium CG_4_10_14_0_8_um_filter_43_86]|uniref:Radical SAM core domain-containing protein n=2 Tax=Candidatus Collieribacteriota TaxID=1752725 RepID=A0A2M8BVN1_9BACT|nr:MAG: hypothetical protein COY48_02290 [Candidatus Collierbacteria bacterium CG_4_10_14_0_8_um_filter_43_86]PJB47920.1 MAG: hypothetical protein CO104_02430 [Candidatus Collierbacteria bacterium CG_4_9_14_3_um_filter_43_16]